MLSLKKGGGDFFKCESQKQAFVDDESLLARLCQLIRGALDRAISSTVLIQLSFFFQINLKIFEAFLKTYGNNRKSMVFSIK